MSLCFLLIYLQLITRGENNIKVLGLFDFIKLKYIHRVEKIYRKKKFV
jgi:hypothetical protein